MLESATESEELLAITFESFFTSRFFQFLLFLHLIVGPSSLPLAWTRRVCKPCAGTWVSIILRWFIPLSNWLD